MPATPLSTVPPNAKITVDSRIAVEFSTLLSCLPRILKPLFATVLPNVQLTVCRRAAVFRGCVVVVISSFYLYGVTREASNELIWVEPLQL